MRIAYFDCFSGISGDMCLGALVDAGAPPEKIAGKLKKLPVRGYRLAWKKALRAGIAATKVDVLMSGKNARYGADGKRWADIENIIRAASLPEDMARKGLEIFRLLFAAESRVHGAPFKKVHLHELGAVDCLVDVFGTLIGLDLLGVEAVYASPVNLGGGTVETAHGILPVPAPATAEILRGVPAYQSGAPFELATPTGAAILKTLAERFGEMPSFTAERIGYGAGKRVVDGKPNLLRIFIGDTYESRAEERVTVIETNIDDMNPQAYESLVEMLFSEGAVDVFMTQTLMKKTRPGVKLTVLCGGELRDGLVRLILRETTSIGVRYYEMSRVTMKRHMRKIRTKYGSIGIKVSSLGDIEKSAPEYEDCRAIAKKSGIPLLQVIDEARLSAAKDKKQ